MTLPPPTIMVFLDTLFCEESHFLHQEEISESDTSLNPLSFLNLFDQDDELLSLLHKEHQIEPHQHFSLSPQFQQQQQVLQWMLRVIAYYSFSSLTAVLAVTYFHRFLHHQQSLPHTNNKPWMLHLAAVASLSLAAKLDETDVPLLLDLQVEEPRYIFEPKNIQKMEILILSTLEWKMNLITPFAFLDYIARRLSLNDHLSREFLTRCERLILSVLTDSRFMGFLPSTMATATMVHVITSIDPSIDLEHQDQLLGILGINKDKVRDCCTLIQEVATNVGINSNNKRKLGSLSPKGVFDLSDSSNDSWASSNSSSASSSPQPNFKKIKKSQFSEF